MTRRRWLIASFLLLLGALPLISLGTDQDSAPVWSAGLVLLGVGFLVPLALRFGLAPTIDEDEPDVGEEPS